MMVNAACLYRISLTARFVIYYRAANSYVRDIAWQKKAHETDNTSVMTLGRRKGELSHRIADQLKGGLVI